jgi:hypothetical protein
MVWYEERQPGETDGVLWWWRELLLPEAACAKWVDPARGGGREAGGGSEAGGGRGQLGTRWKEGVVGATPQLWLVQPEVGNLLLAAAACCGCQVFITPLYLAAVMEHVDGEDLQTFLTNTGGR